VCEMPAPSFERSHATKFVAGDSVWRPPRKESSQSDSTLVQQDSVDRPGHPSEVHRAAANARMHGRRSGSDRSSSFGGASSDMMNTTMILQEHLVDSGESGVVAVVMHLLGLKEFRLAIRRERDRRSREDFVHPRPRVHRLATSVSFEVVIGLVMCVNAVLIGIQTSIAETEDETVFYDVAEQVFTLVFTAEAAIRILSDGWTWLFSPTNFWDIVLVIFTGVIPMWFLKPLGVNSDAFRLLSVVRVLRMIKLVRMVRMVPLFHILYHLMIGLLGSVRMLLFTYLILGVLLYILAVFSVSWVGRGESFRNDSIAQEYFQTVPKAVLTLLQVFTCDWTSMARVLKAKSWAIVGVCVSVILVLTLVLSNLITAVICNAAIDQAKDDEEILARQKRDALAAEIRDLQDLFSEIDEDQSGKLSKDEYTRATQENPRVKMKLQILGIGPQETEDIWELLPQDGHGQISAHDFAETMHALQGDAKAKDTFGVLWRLQHTNARIERLWQRLQKHGSEAIALKGLATCLDKDVGSLMRDLTEMVAFLGTCVPCEPVRLQEEDIIKFTSGLGEVAQELW